ncbi:MAG TPA: ribonuclease R [Elusimicrobia bacterium]|nr:MAG: hypothetical protein A2278_00340 [Elusimicrobia bacterium RIFOXYA12_FULL_49_49]OGS15110.1 MAG: hypothetical protein A2251_00350 [Elusimicrobia bacterium RIFOXYA2_FULL_47_53]OGS29730.1 MAG: hypothetical protein A2323_01150 [Elusimicrobia bacterium RIFOXYB2_FULL_46_23]HBU70207.1 ribonuclease R [Elusimicrobiota bacterium]
MSHHWHRRERHHSAGRQGAIVEGVIQHHGRFAFLLANEAGGSDVFLRGPGLNLAMDGDRVSARVRPEPGGRFTGEILEVLEHANKSMVGVLRRLPRGWLLFPEKGYAPAALVEGFNGKVAPLEGALAVLEVTRWPTEKESAAGIITEVLGATDDTRARITSLLRARGITEIFPKEALAESKAMPLKLEPIHWRGREELFHLPVVTIDGADAKDFDDAVSLEPLGGGLARLGVHIADVANYVKKGSTLDKEAYERGTSVYLPDRVVPMLPESLSNNLCSLVPNQERLTLSVFMDIDREGNVIKRRMANTVIRSCRRFTYDEVQALLDGDAVAAVPEGALRAVMLMGQLAETLYKSRVKRGALDFDLPEYKVETDSHGKPLRVTLRPRLASHRLIEEFMLLANESIATELIAAKAPFLHRRHDEPDPAKISVLAKTLGELGLSAGHLGGGNTHKALQDILRQSIDHPLSGIINSLMVRSMKQAVYSPKSAGHFGIAAAAYAHFTSPIRRYPDLTAHRAIKALLRGEKENHDKPTLTEAGEHCSERERSAAEAEHKAVDLMRAELFKKKIGTVIEGTVTTVIETGSFVLCAETGAEGMLRVTNLKPGTKVRVHIDSVDALEGKISMSLAEKPSMPPQMRLTRGHTRKSRRKRGLRG